MYQLLIKNSRIVDGTGEPSYTADLAVQDGKIVKIGPGIDGEAALVIDGTGLVTAPGFIDMHSHSDVQFLVDDRGQSRIYQGVTSELAGQCGSTVYPCPIEHMDRMQQYAAMAGAPGPIALEYTSSSLEEFLRKVEAGKKSMGTNLIPLIGHGALRCGVMGYENRKADEEELLKMKELLKADMETGAWGLSLGLGYTPGVSSDQEELCALGEVVSEYDGIITSHMRYQDLRTPEALEEMYEINRRTGAHVHIAHFKANGRAAWGKAGEFAANVHAAQQAGIHVTADVYPYAASSSGITNFFPKWSIQGGTQTAVRLLKDPEKRGRLIGELEEIFRTREDGESLYVVTTGEKCPEADGKTIWQLSDELGISMAEAAAKVCVETEAGASCIAFVMSEADVETMLRQNDFAIGSDGVSYSLAPEDNAGKPHPRNFGTFPRFLRLAREKRLCSLETAVRRMTGQTAEYIGLTGRGFLKKGMIADITMFDPDTVSDKATYENPFQKPEGIVHVFMGGEPALLYGRQTEKRLGQFILKK